jgi:hypothetical protein
MLVDLLPIRGACHACCTAEGPYSVARLIFPSAPVLIRASLAIRSVFQGLDHEGRDAYTKSVHQSDTVSSSSDNR